MLDQTAIDETVRERDNQPVFYFGALDATERAPFRLAREITEQKSFGERANFCVTNADPVTTRVLQLWRPGQHGTKTTWLREFIKLNPGDSIVCWLVLMGAVSVSDAIDALLFYGWLGPVPEVAVWLRENYSFWGSRRRAANVRPHVIAALQAIEARAFAQASAGSEWLRFDDASALLDACGARDEAEKEEQAHVEE